MSEIEIALARAYLAASEQDPVAALIRSVRDLAATRSLVSTGYVRGCWPGFDAVADEGASTSGGWDRAAAPRDGVPV